MGASSPTMIQRASGTLPFDCDQVFDLIADIERYPEFLPWCIASRIQRRESNTVYVEQAVGFGPVRLDFASTALLDRPKRIDVTSTDPTFRKYNISWAVETTDGGSRFIVAAEFELQSAFLQYAVDRFLPGAVDGIVAAFGVRAHVLYGPTSGN